MKTLVFLILLLFPINSTTLAGEDKGGVVWTEAEGEAYQGEIETPKEVVERAKRDAQSRAIEQAVGAFIKSHTLVSNSQLSEDLIYAAVRGKIEQVEIIKEGWDENERTLYRIKIKALIKPVYPEKGEGISLKLSLSKTSINEGDKVKIYYEPNSDCYIYIFSIAADGSVTLLFPNSIEPDNSVKAGKTYEFPAEGSKIMLQARFLSGYTKDTAEERIKIIATRQKEEIIPLGFKEGLFKVYDAKSTGMISDLVKKLNQLEPTGWTEATAVYVLKR